MSDHYLILEWAEEPGTGTFSETLDWHVSHPPTCELVHHFDNGIDAIDHWDHPDCPIEYEIDNVGVEAVHHLWDQRDRPITPTCVPIEQWHEAIQYQTGIEYDAGLRIIEQEYTPKVGALPCPGEPA